MILLRPLSITRRACAAGLLSALAIACGGSAQEPADQDKTRIVCTTAMVGDLVREVAGDDAEVTVLFGPDVDPHLFRPTRDDVAALTQASIVFVNGHGLEEYLSATLEKVAASGTRVIPVAESIADETELLREAENVADPHLWMDVKLWSQVPGVIATAIATEGARTRAGALQDRLLALDAEIEQTLAAIPAELRTLITAHDAFAYFGRRYAIDVHAVQGVSTASDAGLRAIEELVDLIVERRAPAVFFESSVTDRNVKALVEGSKARGHELAVGGVLHSDAPGEARTYVAMMRHNAATIAEALGGTAR